MGGISSGQTFVVKTVQAPGGPIHELITIADNLGFGLAFVEERWAKKHHHEKTTEVYVICRGWVKVRLYNGKRVTLQVAKGYESCLTIPPETSHNILGASEDVEIAVFTFPAYDPNDVIFEED